jgi:hypothetical protein
MTESSPPSRDPATPTGKHPTLESLQDKVMELLKNPAVQAGGAVIVGLLIARMAAGSKLRKGAAQLLGNLLATKVISALTMPETHPAEPVVQSAATPPPPAASQPNQVLLNLGRQVFDALAPQIGEVAKKKLAEVLRPRQ